MAQLLKTRLTAKNIRNFEGLTYGQDQSLDPVFPTLFSVCCHDRMLGKQKGRSNQHNKVLVCYFSMVTVIRNGLEEFKASYNPSKFQLYFISSEGITNSSVLVESISENCSEIFPALVMYPGVPLFSVSPLKEGGTGTRNHQLPEMSSCRGRETLAWCVLIPWLCMHIPLCHCLLGHSPLLPH